MFLLGSWCLAAALVLQGQEKYRSPLRCDEDLALCFDTWSLQDLFEKRGRQAARAGTADRHLRKDSSSGCKLGFSREADRREIYYKELVRVIIEAGKSQSE